MATTTVTIVLAGSHPAYHELLFFGFITVLIMLIQNEKQNLSSFLSMQQLCIFFVNKESDAEHTKEEMREMIGNVAHDLKTVSFYHQVSNWIYAFFLHLMEIFSLQSSKPLGSFVSGIETIMWDVNQTKAMSQLKDCSAEVMGGNLDRIIDTVHDMENVSNFMFMAMNRCIDYTKV